jgi:hypothetical protein
MQLSAALVKKPQWSRFTRSADIRAELPSNLHIASWGVIVLVTLAFSLFGFDLYQVGTHYDDARYIILTRSLLEGNTYGMIHLPGPPDAPFYPFGLPLLLAPIMALFPNNFEALKALSLVATVVNATLLFWGWRYLSRRSYWWAVVIVAMYCLAPVTVDLSRRIMSEPAFLTFGLIALLLTERAARGEQSRWWILGLSGSLVFVLFTRSIGIVLVGTIFLYLCFRRGWQALRELGLVLCGMALFLAVILGSTNVRFLDLWPAEYFQGVDASFLLGIGATTSLVDAKGTLSARYVEQPAQPGAQPAGGHGIGLKLKTLIKDFLITGTHEHITKHYSRAIVALGGDENSRLQDIAGHLGIPNLPIVLGYLICLVFGIGLVRWLLQEGISVFNLFALFYMAALAIWNWNDVRLLYPILAQLHLGFLIGIEAILWSSARWLKLPLQQFSLVNKALSGVVALLLVISLVKTWTIDDSRLHSGDMQERSRWLQSHTPSDAIIMSESPVIDYLYSNHKAVPYPWIPDHDVAKLAAYLQENKVAYILSAPTIEWQRNYHPQYSPTTTNLLPLLEKLVATGQLQLVYRSADSFTQVFKFTTE